MICAKQMAYCGTPGITFLCDRYLYHNPARIYFSDSDYLRKQTFASKLLFHECETKFFLLFPSSLIFYHRCSCCASLHAHFQWDYIQLCLDNNLMAKSRTLVFAGAPFYSAASEDRTERNSAGDDWENSKFEWERGDGVTQMCCCSRRAACIRGERARPCAATHKATYACIDGSATQSS